MSKKETKKEEDKQFFSATSRFNALLVMALLSGLLLVVSTYAWFMASLNVRIDFFTLKVENETGLYISLDGIDFSSEVNVSSEDLFYGLRTTYPTHTSQWSGGLFPVSSNGISNPDQDKFEIFESVNLSFNERPKVGMPRDLRVRRKIEDIPSRGSRFIAFDLFFKNISWSEKPDNVYVRPDSGIFLKNDDIIFAPELFNSLRLGFLKMENIARDSSIQDIQGITCNNHCHSYIYEPNHDRHTELSISRAGKYGIELIDGEYIPTFAIIKEGTRLKILNGLKDTYDIDTEHFAIQGTLKDFTYPLFQMPDSVTKVRIYLWVEGQDIDTLEIISNGAQVVVSLSFEKDYAGYE